MQLLFTISVAIFLTGSEAAPCEKLTALATGDTAGANDIYTPYAPSMRGKLWCENDDDLTSSAFFDSNGCDVLRGHVLCESSDTNAANDGKCVPYTHTGEHCPQETKHAIPLCRELDNIAGLSAANTATTKDASGNLRNPAPTHPGQGLAGYHFCQASIKCYHPQAFTVASVDVTSSPGIRLPTPAENHGLTEHCDDYAGNAGDEANSGPHGNWRDHIFDAADHSLVDNGIGADCATDWWNEQARRTPRACTGTEAGSGKFCADHNGCSAQETKEGKVVCSDPNPKYSSACTIHQLPSSNSYSPKAQCAHGVVQGDTCNGITFYFFIDNRGHNYKFNFCRHSGAQATPEVAKAGTGAHYDDTSAANNADWGNMTKNGENQWKLR